MKLLVTGAGGQLGRTISMQAGAAGYDVLACDSKSLDIRDADSVREVISAGRPDACINTAAYTRVDAAETSRELAFSVNADGAGVLAGCCESAGIPILHYSTDYVFDGTKTAAYDESDTPAPANAYGASKWAGEQRVREACAQHYIIRTSWVFSAHGSNFVRRMLELGRERRELSVVTDQIGKPTSTDELSRLALIVLGEGVKSWGTYHLAQPDTVSWFDFAVEIFAVAQDIADYDVPRLEATDSSRYPSAASRPANSALDCGKFEQTFGVDIRPWRDSLPGVIREILGE